MNKTGKIERLTVNLPVKILREAMVYSKANKTATLVMGLEELVRRKAYERIRSYRGKILLKTDLKKTRKSRL